MKPKYVKKLLLSKIENVAANPSDYCMNSRTDFTRNRKLSLKQMLTGIIGMGGGTLSNELLDMFNYSKDTVTSSAFIQQRNKIKPEAFETIFKAFSTDISLKTNENELRILAVDGSDIQIATNPNDKASYFPGSNGQKSYNLLHLNALYDLNQHIYSDAIIQKKREHNEHKAFVDMIDRSTISKGLVIADRGYESYNNMAHIQEKGWKFLIRIKDGSTGIKSSFELPDDDCFDVNIQLKLTRKQTKETKELFKDKNHYKFLPTSSTFDYLPVKNKKSEPVKFYELNFRMVRFQISNDSYETVLTNLDADEYPPEELKMLYAARWGIETSFRDLKYTIGLLNFHSKKVMCIQQEIYAHLTMYNFTQMITSHVVIKKKQRKYIYKANFSIATHMCRIFYYGKTTSPNLEAIIAKNIVPIRPDRHQQRNMITKTFISFLYRVA
ncbi:IS4 family transposase [Clostridium kluyveri]|uniref:IS4 family transposase n=1 Tax=Clostridium kluyveri TaxID=1534 RepID=UPI00224714DD|nr:IS4 family transposase [Clostridium kluyveri]UZQ48916.1 IS4 family transposase [Clostridium kluyveri]